MLILGQLLKATSILVLLLHLSSTVSAMCSSGPFPNRVVHQIIGGDASQFTWFANYDIQLDQSNLEINIQLEIGLEGFNADQALIDTWEAGIESIWSNRYFIRRSDDVLFEVKVDAAFFDFETAPIAQQLTANAKVTVHEGAGAVTLTDWFTLPLANQGRNAAHEIGHMFGLFDEYIGGAVDPNDMTYWNVTDSIMGLGVTETMHERHYQFILDWANCEFSSAGFSFELAPSSIRIPIPPYALLILCFIMISIHFIYRAFPKKHC